MKRFVVSEACNACGECVLRTDLLAEDSNGFAIPVEDRYIRDSELEEAERIAKLCPLHALSVVEQNSIFANNPNLKLLPQLLEEELLKINIPNVDYSTVRYNEKDLTIDHGWANGEGRFIYSSERKAKSAAIAEFDRVYWNRRKEFALNAFMQYRSLKLRQFYDFRDLSKTYYNQFDERYEKVLNKIKLEALSSSCE